MRKPVRGLRGYIDFMIEYTNLAFEDPTHRLQLKPKEFFHGCVMCHNQGTILTSKAGKEFVIGWMNDHYPDRKKPFTEKDWERNMRTLKAHKWLPEKDGKLLMPKQFEVGEKPPAQQYLMITVETHDDGSEDLT